MISGTRRVDTLDLRSKSSRNGKSSCQAIVATEFGRDAEELVRIPIPASFTVSERIDLIKVCDKGTSDEAAAIDCTRSSVGYTDPKLALESTEMAQARASRNETPGRTNTLLHLAPPRELSLSRTHE